MSGNFFIGNGSLLTGITAASSYGNANVAANLAAFGSNPISTTGNITGNFFVGNGSQLTGITAVSSYGNANVVANLAALGSNPVSTTGNVTAGNLLFGSGVASGTGNITGGNIITGGLITATGNVTGNFFIGNGSQLTGIAASYGNANVVANLAALGSNPVSTTGNVTAGNIIGNIVASGAGTPTIASTGNLDLSAVTAVRVVGGGSFRLPSLTTAQVANLTAVNGDMVYNSTTAKIQAYAGNVWGNITLS